MAENPRTTTARDNDDHELIDGMEPAGDAVSSSAGGRLQTDIGSQADLTRAVDDPEARTRPEKEDDMHAGQARPSDRGPHRDNG